MNPDLLNIVYDYAQECNLCHHVYGIIHKKLCNQPTKVFEYDDASIKYEYDKQSMDITMTRCGGDNIDITNTMENLLNFMLEDEYDCGVDLKPRVKVIPLVLFCPMVVHNVKYGTYTNHTYDKQTEIDMLVKMMYNYFYTSTTDIPMSVATHHNLSIMDITNISNINTQVFYIDTNITIYGTHNIKIIAHMLTGVLYVTINGKEYEYNKLRNTRLSDISDVSSVIYLKEYLNDTRVFYEDKINTLFPSFTG